MANEFGGVVGVLGLVSWVVVVAGVTGVASTMAAPVASADCVTLQPPYFVYPPDCIPGCFVPDQGGEPPWEPSPAGCACVHKHPGDVPPLHLHAPPDPDCPVEDDEDDK